MPLAHLAQEQLPDFSTHPNYQMLFDTLLATGQDREQVTNVLTEAWGGRADRNIPPEAPVEPQQQAIQNEPPQPARDPDEQPGENPQAPHQGREQRFPPHEA